jgi:hypothetical protein
MDRQSFAIVVISLSVTSCEYGDPYVLPARDLPEDSVETSIAEALCQRFSSCECDQYITGQSDDLSCEESAAALARAWVEAAREAGLTYNGPCASNALSPSCSEIDHCQIYSGSGRNGEPCTAVGRYMSTCGPWLTCGVDGTCEGDRLYIPTTGRDGDRCGPERGDYDVPCEDGLACLDGRCVTAANLGTDCDPATPCGADGWCSEGTCMTRLAPFAACGAHEACESGICSEGRCTEEQPPECVGFTW